MRKTIVAMLVTIAVAVPGRALANAVTFGTFIDLAVGGTQSVVQSQFFNHTAQATNANSFGGLPGGGGFSTSMFAFGEVNLQQGTVRAQSTGSGVVGQGVGTTTLLYDTLTYDASAFQGAFGASHNLLLSATFTGTFDSSNVFGLGTASIDSGGTGGRIHVYDGSTVIDSSIFNSSNSLGNFLFNGPAPLCANGVNGPDFSTNPNGPFSFSVSCLVQVTAQSPSLHVFMNLPTFINATSASWNLDMSHTGTLSGDFGGRLVHSGSGVFPGTQAASVPEPAMLGLIGLGLLVAGRRITRDMGR